MISPLNDFKEQSWSILNRFSKDLQKITLIIIINKNFIFLQLINILRYLNVHIRKVLSQSIIISVRNSKELNTSASEILYSFDNSLGFERDMLDTSVVIIVDVLLNLGLFLSHGRFVDWHLDILIIVSNDNRPQS